MRSGGNFWGFIESRNSACKFHLTKPVTDDPPLEGVHFSSVAVDECIIIELGVS